MADNNILYKNITDTAGLQQDNSDQERRERGEVVAKAVSQIIMRLETRQVVTQIEVVQQSAHKYSCVCLTNLLRQPKVHAWSIRA